MATGTLFIVSAPSGGGKTTLVNALLKTTNDVKVSISHTTRPPRPGEMDGVDYHFVAETDFAQLTEKNIFLEQAIVFGHHYGTSKVWVEQQLQAGVDIILEIDWQGAAQIKRLKPNSVSIFILPPSREILASRLQMRAQDTQVVIDDRMAKAKSEMSHYAEYDYLLINDDFNAALFDFQAILRAQRLKTTHQKHKYQLFIKELLT